ncbi:hypothetical protein KEM52_006002 [Ascosphaera acerosa]|nr:hypothetical protein KEM52_006002 [Ascosphaera acerosa]
MPPGLLSPQLTLTRSQSNFTGSSSGGGKRKHDPSQAAETALKAAKFRREDSPGRRDDGADAAEGADGGDDVEAGPELPPDFDAADETAGPDDDAEGRFFGGGVSRDTLQAIKMVDQLEERVKTAEPKGRWLAATCNSDGFFSQPTSIDGTWLKKTALSFERRISKNAELRAKYESEPQKFLASEADLDADIKSLSLLSENTRLYSDFADLGCAASLVSLLAHENTDIAIDAIEVIAGLTDEDTEVEQADWDKLVNAMLDADLVELLASNLARLDETSEFDRAGVYHILSVIENLASQVAMSERLCKDTHIIGWLLSRIQQRHAGSTFSQNRQYAAEILSILVQASKPNRLVLIRHRKPDSIGTLLQQLSVYRRSNPEKSSEEEEFVEDMFDCLACLVDEAEGKDRFVDAEGVELCQIMLVEGKFCKSRAVKIMSHACNGRGAVTVCEKVVEVALLKTLFKMFMKKRDQETTERLLSIFNSLLTYLPGGSPFRIRTLAKFMEKDYEKTRRVLELRQDYARRLEIVNDAIAAERKELSQEAQEVMEPGWLSRRLDSGLFSLQVIDVILAWLVAEDEAARTKIVETLQSRGESLGVLRTSLQEQLSELDPSAEADDDIDRREMLSTLMQFLEG